MPDPDSSFYDHAKEKVIFTVRIGTDGLVHDPVLIQSSGNKDADAKALAAVLQWKFKPASREGVPVPVSIKIEIPPLPR